MVGTRRESQRAAISRWNVESLRWARGEIAVRKTR
jgi:hypothetical protein